MLTTAYDYVTEEGLCTEESYPYHASAGECITNCTTHVQPHTVSYGALKATEASFMQQLVKQPVMTAIGLTAGVQVRRPFLAHALACISLVICLRTALLFWGLHSAV